MVKASNLLRETYAATNVTMLQSTLVAVLFPVLLVLWRKDAIRVVLGDRANLSAQYRRCLECTGRGQTKIGSNVTWGLASA